jgi:hypothetical protein
MADGRGRARGATRTWVNGGRRGSARGKPAGLMDLRSSLSSLSNLSTGQLSLEEMLTKVATFAVRAIPGADGAGPTLLEDGRTDTIVATDPFVTEVDAIQYGLGEGPCISAAALRRTMRSGSWGSEPRWPTFGPHVDKLGVHSVLSLPLLAPDGAEAGPEASDGRRSGPLGEGIGQPMA